MNKEAVLAALKVVVAAKETYYHGTSSTLARQMKATLL